MYRRLCSRTKVYVGARGLNYNRITNTQSLIRSLLDLLEDVALLQRRLPLPFLSSFPISGIDDVRELLLA